MSVNRSVKRHEFEEQRFIKAMIAAIQIVCDEGGNIRHAVSATMSLDMALADAIHDEDRGLDKPVPRVRLNKLVLKSTYFS